jgi:membrane protein DedA with SNARE-associated domain
MAFSVDATTAQLILAQAQPIMDFVRANQAWAAPIVFLLAFGESLAFVSLVLPFWAMLVGIGALVTVSGLSFYEIWIAASLGAALGDWVSYWIGARYGWKVKDVWPFTRFPNLLPQGEAFFQRYGWLAVVLGRFSGPLRASVPLVAGIVKMPQTIFQLANFGSAFLWAGALMIPGAALAQYIARP